MFTQKVTISSKELLEALYDKGHLHENFKDSNLKEVSYHTIKAQSLYLCSEVTFEFETSEFK